MDIRDLPGPPRLPLVGNVLAISVDTIHQQLEAWAREYGEAYRLDLGPRRFAVLSNPGHVHQVLCARPRGFCKTNAERICEELGIPGPLSAEGSAWKRQRRLVMAALSPKHADGFYPTLVRVSERFVRRLATLAKAGAEVDIQGEVMRLLIDATTSLAFGRDFNTIDGGEQLLQTHLERVFAKMMDRMVAPLPYWRLLRMPSDRAADRAVVALHEVLDELVASERERIAQAPEGEEPSNFLAAMLAARDDQGEAFADADVFGNIVQILLAGEDTTANTVAWAVHHLCDAPEIVARFQAELDERIPAGGVPDSREIAASLDYATGIANEALRLRSVLPLLFFTANEPTTFGELHVDQGEHVITLLRAAGLDPHHIDQPERFLPERWADPGEVARLQRAGVFVPFGSGPRICAGRSLALLEAQLVLGILYRNFTPERIGPSAAVSEQLQMTMRPVGLRVRLHPRA